MECLQASKKDGHTVCASLDSIGQLGDGNLEARLNCVEHFGILFRRNESDCQTFCTKTSCTTDSVQVRVCIARSVVVDDD